METVDSTARLAGRASERPRADAWGDEADRAALRQLAEDVARRARFRVCAIEVLRADQMLEFVAIVGSTDGEKRLMGQASPLTAMVPAFRAGAQYGALTFVAAEWLSSEALDALANHGHVPELPPNGSTDQWRPEDMLVARLCDDHGDLRAVLYLDEPVAGQRLRPDELAALSTELELPFRAVVTTIEREALAQQVRLAHAGRKVVRMASHQLGLPELLATAVVQLREGFRAADLQVHVIDDDEESPLSVTLPPELYAALNESLQRAWLTEEVLIVEDGHVWGDEQLHADHCATLTAELRYRGLGAMILVPVGAGDELLGALLISRGLDGRRWTDSESSAALDVGRDLGRAILNARAFSREQQLITELRRLDDYRAELVATMSHELKNPIGVILGHLEIIESRPAVPAEIKVSLAAMGRGAARLEALANNLLVLSRLGNPDHPLVGLPVDLAAVQAEVVELECLRADQRGIRIEVTPPASQAVVRGDPDELQQLVTNLVGNAVKYSDAGSVVRVSVEHTGQEVLLTVADEGLGISPEDVSELFTEFFRSTNLAALSRPGTGLGLAIVRRVVERHGGRIDVESRLGHGTTFRVRLPAAT